MNLNHQISNTPGRDERARALGRVYRFLLSLPMGKKDTDAGSHFDEREPTPVGDAPISNELEQDDDTTAPAALTDSGNRDSEEMKDVFSVKLRKGDRDEVIQGVDR